MLDHDIAANIAAAVLCGAKYESVTRPALLGGCRHLRFALSIGAVLHPSAVSTYPVPKQAAPSTLVWAESSHERQLCRVSQSTMHCHIIA